MPTHPKKTVKSYMKPVAKRVTIQKPAEKQKPSPKEISADGFIRINESTIRKVYG